MISPEPATLALPLNTTGYELDCNGSCNIVEDCSVGGTLTISSGTPLSSLSQGSGNLIWIGATSSASSTYEYTIINNLVILTLKAFSGSATSTAAFLSLSVSLPSSITPSFTSQFTLVVLSASSNVQGSGVINSGGNILIYAGNTLSGNFGTTGNNGIPDATTICYYIN